VSSFSFFTLAFDILLSFIIVSRCQENESHVATYLYGQKPTTDRPNTFICDGNVPRELVSKAPRLALKFSAGDRIAGPLVGFKATFHFVMGE